MSLREDDRLAYIQIHNYDFMGDPVEFNFDRRTIPALIDALTRLNRGEDDATIRTHYFNQDIK